MSEHKEKDLDEWVERQIKCFEVQLIKMAECVCDLVKRIQELEKKSKNIQSLEEKIEPLERFVINEIPNFIAQKLRQHDEFFKKIEALEERITTLENRALVYGKWPENEDHINKMSEAIRKIIRKSQEEERIIGIKCKVKGSGSDDFDGAILVNTIEEENDK